MAKKAESPRHDEIPLADDDSDIVLESSDITATVTNFGPIQSQNGGLKIKGVKMASPLPKFLLNRNGALISPDDIQDAEERAALISHVLELQNTLEDLSLRVDCVRGDSDKLRGENSLLGQYIGKLMNASSAFKAVKIKEGQTATTELSLPSKDANCA